MKNNPLKFIPRDTRDHSKESIAQRRYMRMKGKSLKNILLDKFINQYGYDKGVVTANAIVDDLLTTIEHFYQYSDNSFIKPGQMVWHAVPSDENPKKGKSIAQTKLKPVILDIICDEDIEDMKKPLRYREIRIKKCERWTRQAYDQGALLSQLDLATLMGVNEYTAGLYVREYYSLYNRKLPTRGNIQQIGSGQTHKKEIVSLFLKGYLVPVICQKNQSFQRCCRTIFKRFRSHQATQHQIRRYEYDIINYTLV